MDSKVIRIVNLDDNTTDESLKHFIEQYVILNGIIETLFVRKDELLQLVFAYIVFEYDIDAKKTLQHLNGFYYSNLYLEVELIGPRLQCKKYHLNSENAFSKPLLVFSIQRDTKSRARIGPRLQSKKYDRDARPTEITTEVFAAPRISTHNQTLLTSPGINTLKSNFSQKSNNLLQNPQNRQQITNHQNVLIPKLRECNKTEELDHNKSRSRPASVRLTREERISNLLESNQAKTAINTNIQKNVNTEKTTGQPDYSPTTDQIREIPHLMKTPISSTSLQTKNLYGNYSNVPSHLNSSSNLSRGNSLNLASGKSSNFSRGNANLSSVSSNVSSGKSSNLVSGKSSHFSNRNSSNFSSGKSERSLNLSSSNLSSATPSFPKTLTARPGEINKTEELDSNRTFSRPAYPTQTQKTIGLHSATSNLRPATSNLSSANPGFAQTLNARPGGINKTGVQYQRDQGTLSNFSQVKPASEASNYFQNSYTPTHYTSDSSRYMAASMAANRATKKESKCVIS